MHADLGARLQALRQQRGLSLRGLAELVPCSHVHIHDLERGRKAASPELIRRLDLVLEAGGALVDAQQPAAAAFAWQPGSPRFATADAAALADALAGEPADGDVLRLAHEWMVHDPPQLHHLRAGRRIGMETVATVEQRVHQLRLMDDHIGGQESYRLVAGELSATATLLREASCVEPVARRLLVAVGELAQLAGWVASDAGMHTRARHHYLTGAWAASVGGDDAVAANNLSCLAYQMATLGDLDEAVVLARTAATRAAGTTPAVRALLGERVAWAHARAGQPQACERALDQVDDVFEATAEDPRWLYWLNRDEIQVMAGRCWTELARPLRAVPILQQATSGYPADRDRESALYLSWLAESLVQAHEVEEAAATALRVAELADGAGSARVRSRVRLLRDRLKPYAGNPVVDEFREAAVS